MTFNFKDEIDSDLFLSDICSHAEWSYIDGLVFEFNVLLEKILVLVLAA